MLNRTTKEEEAKSQKSHQRDREVISKKKPTVDINRSEFTPNERNQPQPFVRSKLQRLHQHLLIRKREYFIFLILFYKSFYQN